MCVLRRKNKRDLTVEVLALELASIRHVEHEITRESDRALAMTSAVIAELAFSVGRVPSTREARSRYVHGIQGHPLYS